MNDRTIISDVLKEVNGFIDSLDDDVAGDGGHTSFNNVDSCDAAKGRTMPPQPNDRVLDVCNIEGKGGVANGIDHGGIDATMEQSEALFCRLNESYSNASPRRTTHDEVYDLASPRFSIEDEIPVSGSNSTSSSVENKPPARQKHGRQLRTPFQARGRQKTPLQSKVQAKPLQSKQGNNLLGFGKRGLPTQQRVHKSATDQIDARCSNEATAEHAHSSKSQKRLSLLLKVAEHPPNTQSNPDDIDDNGYGPILFPLLNDEDGLSTEGLGGNNNSNRPGVRPGEVILVNPNAFENAETSATRIAGRVTVETARLVADVSQISSEDWARSYSFNHVIWSQNGNDGTGASLAKTIVDETLSGLHDSGVSSGGMRQHNLPCTSVVFVAGGYRTGKSQTVFGTKVARLLSRDRTFSGSPRNLHSKTGLIQQIVDNALSSQCQCTVSVLEIGSTLYDVRSQHDVQMRYVDNCGAILPDLHEVEVESAPELDKTLSHLFSGRTTGHGHLVVTLTISTSNGSSQIKLVDLASPDRLNGDVNSNVQVRKSLSALRGVLRGVCHGDHPVTEPTTFRDSLLTQVLQRCLTNASDPKCRRGPSIIMIGTVSPSSVDYNQTLGTMDYLTRLTSKAGDTAKGPFDRLPPPEAAGASKRPSGDGVMNFQLDSLSPRRKSSIASQQCVTSDPRQRLARLLHNAPLINERKSNMTKKSSIRSTSNKVVSVISPKSPKSSNVSSGSRDYRESYTSVFDQLDSLMTAEAERIDRNSFGESMIHALTPAKSHSKVRSNSAQGQETGDEASSGSEEEVPFSPLYEQFVNAPSSTAGMTRRSPHRYETKSKRMASTSSSNSRVSSCRSRDTPGRTRIFETKRLDRLDGTPIRTFHNETSESPSISSRSGMSTLTDHDRASVEDTISQQARSTCVSQVKVDRMNMSNPTPTRTEPSSSAESPSLFSLKSSRTGDNLSASQDIGQPTSQPSLYERREDETVHSPKSTFVSKATNLPPIRGMASLDSMDSDPLVSPSRQVRQGSGPPFASPPMESLAVPRSPSDAILKSFQNDFKVLVSEEVVDDAKIARVNETTLDSAIEFPIIDRLALSDTKRHESETASLRNTISLLQVEKSTSDEILRQIYSMLKVDGTLEPPEAVETLKSMFDQSKKSTEDLQNQLDASREECNELAQKLETNQGKASELSESFNLVKKEVVETRRQRDAELERSAVLESEIINLKVQLDGHGMQISTLTSFFAKINALLGTNVDDSAALDIKQHEISFDSIQQLGENDRVMKQEVQRIGIILEEALERESLAKQAKGELQMKVSRLEDESRLASEANSRTETKRREAEQLAEEAVSSNETLTAQIEDLKSKSKALEDEKVALLSEVQDLLESNRAMEKERDVSSLEISKLKISLDARNDEKRQFKERLESIKLKTAEVMKQSIESLKKEYTSRLEEYKTAMVRQEAQIDELKMKEAAVNDSGEQVSQLKSRVHDRDTEISSLRRRLDEFNATSSSKICSAESRVSQLLSQLELARNDATTQREQNEALKREVENLRGLMDIAEESVSELNRLKVVNERLNDTIRSQSAGCSSRGSRLDIPFEIHDRRFAHDTMSVAKQDEDNFMLERVSTLMRENENNNISMRALQGENIALKGSIDDCTNTIEYMQTEMRELKSIASQGMTNIRSREQRDKDALRQMDKKLDSANKLIRALQSNHGGTLYRDEVSPSSDEFSPTRSNRRLTTPNRLGHQSLHNDADINTPSRILKSRQEKKSFVAELSAEKELRYKAEEIAAGVLANSKSALQERDSEIDKLRSKLRQLSGKQRKNHTGK